MLRRGDVDDRVLPEAILPLLQALSTTTDVRPVLHRRFDMPRWFLSQVKSYPSAPQHTCACQTVVSHICSWCMCCNSMAEHSP